MQMILRLTQLHHDSPRPNDDHPANRTCWAARFDWSSAIDLLHPTQRPLSSRRPWQLRILPPLRPELMEEGEFQDAHNVRNWGVGSPSTTFCITYIPELSTYTSVESSNRATFSIQMGIRMSQILTVFIQMRINSSWLLSKMVVILTSNTALLLKMWQKGGVWALWGAEKPVLGPRT